MSFVPRRQGIDNAIICHEFVHSICFTKARKGVAIIKVDLDKAYDRMECGFVDQTLEDTCLLVQLRDVIMQSILCGSRRLIWNGEITDMIKSSWCLRQGDPLSPHLFVLCTKRLGHWIGERVENGSLISVKAVRRGPGLSYLFFGDALLFFTKAVDEQLSIIK